MEAEIENTHFIITLICIFLLFFACLIMAFPACLHAKVTGDCAKCHTMHNSQGGLTMNGQATPYPLLVRSQCMGCHGMGGAQKIATFAGQDTPQVYHTDSTGDLAGGNFAYITGDKGSGASVSKGHNVMEINYPETILSNAPGRQHDVSSQVSAFTCAGTRGCHGRRRGAAGQGVIAMQGAHHRDVDGKCDAAVETPDSYRFVRGVKGLENTGSSKWQNADVDDHNEYFGATTPMPGGGGCGNCHDHDLAVKPLNQTISGFCGTCHYNFHSVTGIGGDTVAPFTRHPTDVILPVGGEYAAYTVYNTTAPVARTTVPDTPGSTVLPGTDVVMCLSCHVAHASDHSDLLRWDYSTMVTGGGANNTGCFVCHTKKDDGN